MQTVSVEEATANFPRLLQAIEHGEDVVIARGGEPIPSLSSRCRKIAPPVIRRSASAIDWFGELRGCG